MGLDHAKTLRKTMTDAERRLWYRLRAHRFAGEKFKRQVPIDRYIVDFACLNRKLVIELDGGQHSDSSTDQARDERIRQKGFRILRFWNNDVLKNTEGVLTEIINALESSRIVFPSPGSDLRSSPPSPRFAGRGESK